MVDKWLFRKAVFPGCFSWPSFTSWFIVGIENGDIPERTIGSKASLRFAGPKEEKHRNAGPVGGHDPAPGLFLD